jgi:hypothetical protein
MEATMILGGRRSLNKRSTKPVAYGERFVKRRGLFCLMLASRYGVVQVA